MGRGVLFKDAGEMVDIKRSLSVNNAEVPEPMRHRGHGHCAAAPVRAFVVEDALSEGQAATGAGSPCAGRTPCLYAVRPFRRFGKSMKTRTLAEPPRHKRFAFL